MQRLKATIWLNNLHLSSRDYLLHSPDTTKKSKTISRKDGEDKAVEKKEKKIKEMSNSRVRKFQKLFGQQITADEKLVDYFSCALVSEILLQGHLYVSQNFFSFYSNGESYNLTTYCRLINFIL